MALHDGRARAVTGHTPAPGRDSTFFAEAALRSGKKKQITLRLDPDVVEFREAKGRGRLSGQHQCCPSPLHGSTVPPCGKYPDVLCFFSTFQFVIMSERSRGVSEWQDGAQQRNAFSKGIFNQWLIWTAVLASANSLPYEKVSDTARVHEQSKGKRIHSTNHALGHEVELQIHSSHVTPASQGSLQLSFIHGGNIDKP